MIKTKTLYAFLYHWHQRIGLVMCIAVIAWALSGLAHPVISRLNPKPVAPPPVEMLDVQQMSSFSQLIERQDIHTIYQLRLFQWQGQPVFRIQSDRGLGYYSAITHELLTDTDFEYAEYLARHILGDEQLQVTNLRQVGSFDKEYLYINRYLPVIRVDFARDDRVRVYIDAVQGRLATIDNQRKVLTGKFFRTLHSWTWIESIFLRRSLMSIFLVLGFTTAAFGLVVYVQSWRMGIFRKTLSAHQHHPRTRQWHRRLGAVTAIFAMAFCASGLLHLWLTNKTDQPQGQLPLSMAAGELRLDAELLSRHFHHTAIDDIQLAQWNNTAYWRIKKRQHHTSPVDPHQHHHDHAAAAQSVNTQAVVYLHAHTGDMLADGWEAHARFLATELTGYPADRIRHSALIEKFSGEYGFINKRLPVHAVHFDLPGNPAVYVETASHILASEVRDSKRLEGYSFAYLHKWHFADFLGKDIRDLLTSSMALLILLTLGLGVYRYARQRQKRLYRG